MAPRSVWFLRFEVGNWPASHSLLEALSGARPLGIDRSAHVQPDSSYHYHGVPIGLIDTLGPSFRRVPITMW